MAINRSLSCRRRHVAVLLLLLILPLFAHCSRLFVKERQPQRTTNDNNNNMTVPACSSKNNDYTVRGIGNASLSSSWSGVDDSDRLVPTGPNPLHHRHH